MKAIRYFLIALGIIIIDQLSKMLVYFNMQEGEEFSVFGDWFRIHYLLNPGMAFGWEWDNEYGKLALTLFRLVAMVGIAYYLYSLAKKEEAKNGLLVCMALILGGAVGNVIDSTFYGVWLEGNAIQGSFTPWFHGQVIDMLYFPLVRGVFWDWLPFVGGDSFLFFSPVFNIADSSIFIGVASILIFQKKFFEEKEEETGKSKEDETDVAEVA